MMTDFVLFRGVIFERVSFCPSFFHFFLEIGPTNFFFLKSDKVSDCISLMCWCSATHFRFKTRKNLKLLRSDNKLCPITDFSRKNTRETSDHTNSQKTDQKSGLKIRVVRPSGDELSCCGPIQWARGDVGRKPSAAARPRTLVQLLWRAAAAKAPPLTARPKHTCKTMLHFGSSCNVEFGHDPVPPSGRRAHIQRVQVCCARKGARRRCASVQKQEGGLDNRTHLPHLLFETSVANKRLH